MKSENKSAHTPGPWTRSLSDCRVVLAPSRSFGNKERVNERIADVGSGVQWSDEVEANASLIAAAPDLLAALGRIIHVAKGRDFPAFQYIEKEARAAIAKTGVR